MEYIQAKFAPIFLFYHVQWLYLRRFEVWWSPRQTWTNDTILHEKMAGTKEDKQKNAFIWMAKFATNQHSSHFFCVDSWQVEDWLTPGGKVGFGSLKQFILPFIFILKLVFSPFSFCITQYRFRIVFFLRTIRFSLCIGMYRFEAMTVLQRAV